MPTPNLPETFIPRRIILLVYFITPARIKETAEVLVDVSGDGERYVVIHDFVHHIWVTEEGRLVVRGREKARRGWKI